MHGLPDSSDSFSLKVRRTAAGERGLAKPGLGPKFLMLALLPLILSLASLVVAVGALVLGMIGVEFFYSAFVTVALILHSVLLPLYACKVHQANERDREEVNEKMSEFASRLVELHGTCHRSPRVNEDPRVKEAFKAYMLADEELGKDNLGSHRGVRELVDHGSSLARRALAGAA